MAVRYWQIQANSKNPLNKAVPSAQGLQLYLSADARSCIGSSIEARPKS
jgi:hypothetical protein